MLAPNQQEISILYCGHETALIRANAVLDACGLNFILASRAEEPFVFQDISPEEIQYLQKMYGQMSDVEALQSFLNDALKRNSFQKYVITGVLNLRDGVYRCELKHRALA